MEGHRIVGAGVLVVLGGISERARLHSRRMASNLRAVIIK
jgi:hypothetical protein